MSHKTRKNHFQHTLSTTLIRRLKIQPKPTTLIMQHQSTRHTCCDLGRFGHKLASLSLQRRLWMIYRPKFSLVLWAYTIWQNFSSADSFLNYRPKTTHKLVSMRLFNYLISSYQFGLLWMAQNRLARSLSLYLYEICLKCASCSVLRISCANLHPMLSINFQFL